MMAKKIDLPEGAKITKEIFRVYLQPFLSLRAKLDKKRGPAMMVSFFTRALNNTY